MADWGDRKVNERKSTSEMIHSALTYKAPTFTPKYQVGDKILVTVNIHGDTKEIVISDVPTSERDAYKFYEDGVKKGIDENQIIKKKE